jgi:hypothetical protein
VAGVAEHEAEQGVPLLREVAQPVLVRRRVHQFPPWGVGLRSNTAPAGHLLGCP